MTTVIGMASLAKALEDARMRLDPSSASPSEFWSTRTATDDQLDLIKMLATWGPRVQTMDGVHGICTTDKAAAEAWIAEHGLDVPVPDIDSRSFVALGTATIGTNWPNELEQGSVAVGRHRVQYPAIKADQVRIWAVPSSNPLVELPGADGTNVYVTKTGHRRVDPMTVIDTATALEAWRSQSGDGKLRYGDAIVPMVDLDVTPDISWVEGLETADEAHYVSSAAQRVRFMMDHIGAEAADTSVVRVTTRSLPPEPIVIDGPFLAYITDADGNLGFAAVITREHFAQPRR